eukprot:7388557-Prymnesium_polylepis.1
MRCRYDRKASSTTRGALHASSTTTTLNCSSSWWRSAESSPPRVFSSMRMAPSTSGSSGIMPNEWIDMPPSNAAAARLVYAIARPISPRARSSASSRLTTRDLPTPASPSSNPARGSHSTPVGTRTSDVHPEERGSTHGAHRSPSRRTTTRARPRGRARGEGAPRASSQ